MIVLIEAASGDSGLIVGWLLGLVSTGVVAGVGWFRNSQHQRKLRKVADHYTSGTALLNAGAKAQTQRTQSTWKRKYSEWQEEMIVDARKVNYARAEHLQTLLTFPDLTFSGVTDKIMQHQMSMLAEALKRMAVFISV